MSLVRPENMGQAKPDLSGLLQSYPSPPLTSHQKTAWRRAAACPCRGTSRQRLALAPCPMTGAALCRAQAVRRESSDPKSARRRGSGAGANLRFTPRRAGRPAEPSGRLPGALNGADALHPHSAFRQRSCLRPRPSPPPRCPARRRGLRCPGRPVPVRACPGVGRSARSDAGIRSLPEPMARPAAHTLLPGCPRAVGRLAAGAVLRNRLWPPWSRLRQSLHRSSLQNPGLAGSPARQTPPNRQLVPMPMGAHTLARPASFPAAAPPTAVARLLVYGLRGRERPREASRAPARPEPAA